MKLNTNISIENVIAILVIVCSMTLAFGFMKADVNSIKKEKTPVLSDEGIS